MTYGWFFNIQRVFDEKIRFEGLMKATITDAVIKANHNKAMIEEALIK